jgi:hypothetical protein
MTATIQRDPIEIKKDKKLTLETAYGHEQRHVQNAIAIMKEAQRRLATIEDKKYNTTDEARKMAVKYLSSATKWVATKLKLDEEHRGTDPKSPKDGEPYPPIGTMPKEPEKPKQP